MARRPSPTGKVYWQGEGPPPNLQVDWTPRLVEADYVLTARPLPGEGEPLTPREHEILEFLADGWSNEEMADRLAISLHTVKFHLSGLYAKLKVGRRTEAVREGLVRGLITL